MAKAVFNLDLGGGMIKHTHPEVTQNTSDISSISSDYVSLTQDQTINSNKIINGSVTLNGLFTATSAVLLEVETIPVSGSTIVLNHNITGEPFENGSLVVNRGIQLDAYMQWNEALNVWQAGLDGDLYTIALEDHEVSFSGLNVGDSITTSNSTRVFNIADSNGVVRVLSIGLDPSLEFIHRDSADGVDNSYWDIGADDTDYFFIRRRTNGPITSALIIDNNLDVTISTLSGITSGKIITSDENGKLQATNSTITEGPAGGSILNMTPFSADPATGGLQAYDSWLLEDTATSAIYLKVWNGTYKYSVELARE